jgi:3-methyl-2-oxobutanoate hydroxymethyltransferase
MSQHTSTKRLTIPALMKMKGVNPIVALTAYTTPQAEILDAYAEMLLVGDSLGMVLYGMESTLPVTLEDMIRHGTAVVRGSHHACVIVDMPYGSYQQSPADAFANAAQILKRTGAQGVKLEGGMEMAETVRFLCERAIPVIAHIGLKPQYVHQMGGYRVQGRNDAARALMHEEAHAFEQAGAFALLLEGVEAELAASITAQANIPTIGIGAGVGCDGQILVTEDMMGMHETTPSFVRQFGKLREVMHHAASAYRDAVKQRTFPDDAHSFQTKK